MDLLEELYRALHLVRLEMPDEMPPRPRPDQRDLRLGFLDPALAQVRHAQLQGRRGEIRRHPLGHGQEPGRARRTSGAVEGPRHALPNVFEPVRKRSEMARSSTPGKRKRDSIEVWSRGGQQESPLAAGERAGESRGKPAAGRQTGMKSNAPRGTR